MGVGYSPNLGSPCPGSVIGLDGKDQPLPRENTQTSGYRDRDHRWPRRVAALLRVSDICSRRPTVINSSTTVAAGAVAEKRQRRRGERLRARESVMIQMYNSIHHADLDSSLASLRRSLRQCSIQGDEWATTSAVSAALRQVGVTVSDSMVRVLASQDGYRAGRSQDGYRAGRGRPAPQPAQNILQNYPATPTAEEDKRYAEDLFQCAKNIPQNNPATLAGEDDKTFAEGLSQSAKNILRNMPVTPAGGEEEQEDRLVFWRSIMDFLEEGPSDYTSGGDDAVFAVGRKGELDAAIVGMGSESALRKGSRKSRVMHSLDGSYPFPGTNMGASPTRPSSSVSGLPPMHDDDDGDNNDSEEKNEPDNTGGGGGGGGGASGFAREDNHTGHTAGGGSGQSSDVTKSGGRRLCPLEQGPRNVKGGLRAIEVDDGNRASLPPRGVTGGTTDRNLGVPSKGARGAVYDPHREGKDPFSAGGGEEEAGQRQLGCERGASLQRVGVGETVERDRGDEAESDAFRDPGVDAESLVNSACMAGKKGDAAVINDLADRVDLRRNDAFGRNALYYACLCGHAGVAHLVTARAYGGVEGIPESERWECRKNALSEEIQSYLDTGIFPETVPSQREPLEHRAAQAPALVAGGKERGSTSTSKGPRGFKESQERVCSREKVGGDAFVGGTRHTPPAPAVEGRGCGITSNPKGSGGFEETQKGVNCRDGADGQGSESCMRHSPRTPAVEERGCGIALDPKDSSRGFIESQEGGSYGEGLDCQGSASGARHTPPADEAFTIASLFDSARDQEENGDY